jgi:hypothetical protein
VNQRGYFLH